MDTFIWIFRAVVIFSITNMIYKWACNILKEIKSISMTMISVQTRLDLILQIMRKDIKPNLHFIRNKLDDSN